MLTKEQVKHSMEAKWRLHQARLYAILLAVILGFFLFAALSSLTLHGFSSKNIETALFACGMAALIFFLAFAPFVLFYLYRYLSLFRDLETYIIHEVTLERPSTSYWYRGAVYYTVQIENQNIDTLPLWSSGIFSQFSLAEYNNRTIKVAYSEALAKLIVLG